MRAAANGKIVFMLLAFLGLISPTVAAAATFHHPIRHPPVRRRPLRRPFHHPIVFRRIIHPKAHQPELRHAVYRAERHPVRRVVAPRPLIRRVAWTHSWVECVPYARAVSGIDLTGDAYVWWGEASGRYHRGDVPAPGSVLAFRPTWHMHLGHVAVVMHVINRREVLVEQANWVPGRVTKDVPVIDVSPNHSWSEVRVGLPGGDGRFGAVYPTYGFIYPHGVNEEVAQAEESEPGLLPSTAGQQFAAATAQAGPWIAPSAPDRHFR